MSEWRTVLHGKKELVFFTVPADRIMLDFPSIFLQVFQKDIVTN